MSEVKFWGPADYMARISDLEAEVERLAELLRNAPGDYASVHDKVQWDAARWAALAELEVGQ